ncbi:DUF2218 domain-containing protein [Primorskyibacter flagellatus]|uniref:DUF2218 domain-containing protein n=1 Tax=Primorskyibacter flagellatus TaxID=1387277 RepID=A0A1W2CAQ0_9RHOB|nr:DUF2218 domain-containing protein [Primorskyibacter flagellatus]SMC82229.1 hypothetical protein SAMN06295998_10723 [Primorskyibacter flagellatus]
MHKLIGRFETPNASKYLQQLCKHFAHKIKVDHTAQEGICHFVMGPAYLSADEVALTVRFELSSPDHTDAARGVIDSHLETFAFREGFKHMSWSS